MHTATLSSRVARFVHIVVVVAAGEQQQRNNQPDLHLFKPGHRIIITVAYDVYGENIKLVSSYLKPAHVYGH